jgi:hypothetical protein
MKKGIKMKKPISEYFDAVLNVVVKVYDAPKSKRTPWMKNDTFYAAKMRIEDGSGMFANFSRKPGKA